MLRMALRAPRAGPPASISTFVLVLIYVYYTFITLGREATKKYKDKNLAVTENEIRNFVTEL